MAIIPTERRSLLSSQARVQAPWIKVKIGDYTFGVFSKKTINDKDKHQFYSTYNIQYPNYIKSLRVDKVNGQVNQYTLTVVYPVRVGDDPNFFDKVLSSTSDTRKIVFSYGDASMPTYVYKDEEAIITQANPSFSFGAGGQGNSVITYTIKAVSSAALGKTGAYTFSNVGKKKPSDEIKRVFRDTRYGLRNIFTGMSEANIDKLIAGDDKEVELMTKTNISPIDYISYLVGCMIPAGTVTTNISKDIYLFTIHDDTIYDELYNDEATLGGAYFKVTRTSYTKSYSDAYEVNIGYNDGTIVTNFSANNNESFSLFYDYQSELHPEEYKRVLNADGTWEDEYSPAFTSRNSLHKTNPEDVVYYTKLTKYPITASITIQGLLRPAQLMTYLRLNIIFPGGRKHIYSGLYIVTSQQDTIDESGYKTTLGLTRIDGDNTQTVDY